MRNTQPALSSNALAVARELLESSRGGPTAEVTSTVHLMLVGYCNSSADDAEFHRRTDACCDLLRELFPPTGLFEGRENWNQPILGIMREKASVCGAEPESRALAIQIFEQILALQATPEKTDVDQYVLCLLVGKELEKAESCLQRYRDDGHAPWIFNWALLEFLKGSGAISHYAASGNQRNKFIVDYLLGRKDFPYDYRPKGFDFRNGKYEAFTYCFYAISLWEEIPGATDWLERQFPGKKRAKKQKSRGEDSLSQVLEEMLVPFEDKIINACQNKLTNIRAIAVQLADLVFSLEPWNSYPHACVSVSVFDREQPEFIAFPTGHLEEMEGLAIYLHSATTHRLLEGIHGRLPGVAEDDEVNAGIYRWAAETVLVTAEPLKEFLPKERDAALKALSKKQSEVTTLPQLQSKRRGFFGWNISDAEALCAAVTMYAAIPLFLMARSSRMKPDKIGNLVSLPPEGRIMRAAAPHLKKHFDNLDRWQTMPTSTRKKILDASKRTSGNLMIGLVGGIGAIQRTPLSRPELGAAVAIMELEMGLVVTFELISGEISLEMGVAKALANLLKQHGSIPAEMTVQPSLVAIEIVATLESLGITAKESFSEAWAEMAVDFMRQFEGGNSGSIH